MKFFKTIKWPPFDIQVLKLSSSSFGIVIGAYFSEFFLQYLWLFFGIGLLAGLKVSYFYFRQEA